MGSAIAGGNRHNDKGIMIKCSQNRTIRQPLRGYYCSVDVMTTALHDRWLILPYLIEENLLPSTPINFIESDVDEQGVLSFSFLKSDTKFNAIPIPAGTQLHVRSWEILSIRKSTVLKVWLGRDLLFSSGGSLTDVVNQIVAQESKMNRISKRVEWTAPQATVALFDPKGFQRVNIRLSSRRKERSK
jgi:hypothetical protein